MFSTPALRPIAISWVCAACLWALTPDSAFAQQANASGSVGAGVFDSEPAAAVDIGFDVAGAEYAMGFGARLYWLASSGFREEDWDERSEWAGLLRYLTYVRDHSDVRASFAPASSAASSWVVARLWLAIHQASTSTIVGSEFSFTQRACVMAPRA